MRKSPQVAPGMIVLGLLLGLYVGLSVNGILGVVVAIGVPVLGILGVNALSNAADKKVEDHIRRKREERKNKWQE